MENEDSTEDAEGMMRAATVRVQEANESKFLGPSSGIAITRMVMHLAKQFSDSRSIKEIVPDPQAREIKELYNKEAGKPTSKVYPLISDVAAVDLPNRDLTSLLVQLYKLKVQSLYPALHEPTLDQDIEAIYALGDAATSYQQFVCRMVIAISLQKMDTQYAGLADSYYLAALKHLEPVVKPMDLKTLQCFALMAEYSLLTPTRTAIYYIIGIAVRLLQALGYNEEKTITRGRGENRADPLEIDMRRRLFWCIMVMDYGLAHSLGRPAMLATSQEHIDVGWFETCDDTAITREGIDPNAQRPTLKKWVAIHFFKMRMLQLEIRKKLYLRKRSEPRNNSDPWFFQMEAKMAAWRDAVPSIDADFGFAKSWFVVRYNTIVVFLWRPSPQVPRPSLEAAIKCYDACEHNIHVHREQMRAKSVDITWIFTQAIFMAINTMLWTLSYEEIRRQHNREEVEGHLNTAIETIKLCAERWPGVASAEQLYRYLMHAILQIYDKEGDVPISANTPSEIAGSPGPVFPDVPNRSRGASPATVASSSVATPPERSAPPFGYLQQQSRRAVEQQPLPTSLSMEMNAPLAQSQPYPQSSPPMPTASTSTFHAASQSSGAVPTMQSFPQQQQDQFQAQPQQQTPQRVPPYFDPYTHFNPLPEFTPNLTVPGWTAAGPSQPYFAAAGPSNLQHNSFDPNNAFNNPVFDPTHPSYPFPQTFDASTIGVGDVGYGYAQQQQQQQFPQQQQQDYWAMDTGSFGTGLNQMQQEELMHDLETVGMEDIRGMISATVAAITPKAPQRSTF